MRLRYEEKFPLNLINENDREFQPRLDYDEATLGALSKDIAKNGQHNPVGLYQKGDHIQVIYGFQRVIALKRLGGDTARANIYEDATWEELHEQSISNNERHLDLGDLEKALYIKQLKDKGFNINRLGELFGVKKSAIYNYLTVTALDDTTQECLHKRLISVNHAVELARYEDFSKRLEKLRSTITWGLSVREMKKGDFTRMLAVNGWISVCPDVMHEVPLYECEKCKHHKGYSVNGDIRKVVCEYEWEQIPVSLRPLFGLAQWEEPRQPVATEVKEK